VIGVRRRDRSAPSDVTLAQPLKSFDRWQTAQCLRHSRRPSKRSANLKRRINSWSRKERLLPAPMRHLFHQNPRILPIDAQFFSGDRLIHYQQVIGSNPRSNPNKINGFLDVTSYACQCWGPDGVQTGPNAGGSGSGLRRQGGRFRTVFLIAHRHPSPRSGRAPGPLGAPVPRMP
jgi:hypothetical protein